MKKVTCTQVVSGLLDYAKLSKKNKYRKTVNKIMIPSITCTNEGT